MSSSQNSGYIPMVDHMTLNFVAAAVNVMHHNRAISQSMSTRPNTCPSPSTGLLPSWEDSLVETTKAFSNAAISRSISVRKTMGYEEVEVSSEEQFRSSLALHQPKAKIVVETGAGETYGEVGTLTAVTGPDMQADVVGIFDPAQKWGWISL